MKAAGILLFLFCMAAMFVLHRVARRHLPDKPMWANLKLDSVDDVGRRCVRWMLFFWVVGVVDIIVLIVTR